MAVVVVELGTIMCGCYQCCLQTLSMSFAPKEEGHFLIPGQRQGFACVCCQGQPRGAHVQDEAT